MNCFGIIYKKILKAKYVIDKWDLFSFCCLKGIVTSVDIQNLSLGRAKSLNHLSFLTGVHKVMLTGEWGNTV